MENSRKVLECSKCRTTFDINQKINVCKVCAGTLLVKYDFNKALADPVHALTKTDSLWRYQNLLPVFDEQKIISLGEGITPLISVDKLARKAGIEQLYIKDESGNPTGTFKSRGMTVAVSRAQELRITHMVIPTAGNAGGALSAYCARAGIELHVFMPKATQKVIKQECHFYGAHVIEVDGNISDCGEKAAEAADENGWFNMATLKEPYRLEGKKTMGYEIAEQLNWETPDLILYPTGGGTGLIGIWKAFQELADLGWIKPAKTRFVSVQSDQCNGIEKAFHESLDEVPYTDKGFTIGNGLRVPKPYADHLILHILRSTGGNALSVSDAEMEAAVREIASTEGLFVAPEGAALWVALQKLKKSGWLQSAQRIVMINTGSGYKYLENL